MSGPGDTIRVLHVDDDPSLSDLVGTFLERTDDRITVQTATNTEAGLDTLSTADIDCIVSDYDMPGRNGIEFLEAVRDDYPDLPFILYTGKGSEEIASEAISAGVTDYLQKESGTDQYEILANRITNAVAQIRAVQEVTRTRTYFETILEHASDYVMVVDENAEVTYISPAVERVLGYTPDNLEGTDAFEYIHPEDLTSASTEFIDVLEHPDEEHTIEYRVRHADGSWRWVEVRGRNRLDDSVIEGIIVSVRDITERKARQQELHQKERRYQAIFNDPNILVGMLDTDGSVLDINETAMEYIDTDLDEITGEPLWESPWFTGDERIQQKVREWIDQAAAGEYVEFELDLSSSMDDPLVVNGVFRPVRNEDGEVVSLLISDRDITEQKQREAKLRRVQQRFEAVLQNTTTPMFMKDDQGAYIFVNQAYCDLFGLQDDQIVGRTDTEIHPEEVAAKVQANDQAVLDRGAPIEAEEQIVVGGEERTFLATKVPIYDTGDRSDPDTPVATFGVAIDITDRKDAEQRLREEQQFVQSIFESLPDPVYAIDTNGDAIRWNEQIEAVTGYSSAEIEEMHVTDFFSDDDADCIAAKFQTVLDERRSATVEADLETKDGVRIPYEFTGGPLQSADESIRGVTGIGRDITERHEHEQQLEELNRITQELVRADTRDDIVEIGVETTRDLLGMKMSAIHLYDDDADALVPAAITETASELIGNPPTFSGDESIAWRIYQQGEPRAVDDVHEDSDRYNPDTPVRSELLLPLGDHGILLAGSSSPATFDEQDVLLGEILAGGLATALEQVERTEQLRAHERELTNQNERLEEFASIVSHDLRNPLDVASGHLELVAEEGDSEHIAHVEQAHERMRTLIEDLLSVAREGDAVTDVEHISLSSLVEECWANVETAEATLVTDIEGSIQGDKSRLKQVFENLMRNAVEHGGENVSVTVGELDDGLYIEDDGSGIPVSERDSVFEAGYSTSEDGTGFGLRIVEQIVEAHDGQIRLSDGADEGARFEITGVEFVTE